MKPISNSVKTKILSLLRSGATFRYIASQLGVSISTVSSVKREHNLDGQLRRRGGQAKLSPTTKNYIKFLIKSGRASNAVQVTRILEKEDIAHVCPQTVRNVLKKAGLRAIKKKKKPRLLSYHKAARLKFAREHKDWDEKDWELVIWSDETIIHLNEPTSCCWAWKETNADIKDQHVQPTVKFGGGYLMLWGCMTARGVGYCCRLDDNMDAELYVQILNDKLRSTLRYYKYKAREITFQQDNDPKHKSRMAQEWFKKHRINVLKWPSQSPDLNPIEHLWRHLKKRLADYEEPPESIDELWERIQDEWEGITPDVCKSLIKSMHNRIEQVLKRKGGYTSY